MIREFLAVGIGGAAGSMARHALSGLVAAGCLAGGFPVGTFAVNAAGSLLIGAVTGYASQQALVPLLAGVGFCGGFTTFSTFSADTVRLLRGGEYGTAAFYVALSLVVCTACTAPGLWTGQILKNSIK